MRRKLNVYTPGSFDLFHVGHLNMLRHAKALCGNDGKLVVGVSTDQFIYDRKNRQCIVPYENRVRLVQGLKYVDVCVRLDGFFQFEDHIRKYDIDIFVIGNDYVGKFDYLKSLCNVIYLSRTENISTTKIIDKVLKQFQKSK